MSRKEENEVTNGGAGNRTRIFGRATHRRLSADALPLSYTPEAEARI